jgi:hypothetical protein
MAAHPWQTGNGHKIPSPAISPELAERVRSDAAKGVGWLDLCYRFSLTRNEVRSIIMHRMYTPRQYRERYGPTEGSSSRPKKAHSTARHERAVKLVLDVRRLAALGKTTRAIARELGKSAGYVARIRRGDAAKE